MLRLALTWLRNGINVPTLEVKHRYLFVKRQHSGPMLNWLWFKISDRVCGLYSVNVNTFCRSVTVLSFLNLQVVRTALALDADVNVWFSVELDVCNLRQPQILLPNVTIELLRFITGRRFAVFGLTTVK